MLLQSIQECREDLSRVVAMNPGHADAVGMLNKLSRSDKGLSETIQPFKGYKTIKSKSGMAAKKLPALGLYTSRSSFCTKP
jgi:hypothetical protein